MSFIGAISTPMRKIVSEYAAEITLPVLLPCAGNFTMGACLRSGGYMGHISGCDITLYTSALGAYLAGDTLVVRERDDCPEHLRGLLDNTSPERLAASLSIMLDLHMVWKCQNAWHRRVLHQYRASWPELIDKTLARLEAYRAHMTQGGGFRYYAMDAMEYLDSQDNDHAVLIYPPTYGTKGYLNLEKIFAASLEWRTPEYSELDFQEPSFYEKIASFRQWLVILEERVPELEKILGAPVALLKKNDRVAQYVYARHSKHCIVKRYYLPSLSPGAIFPSSQRLTGDEEPGIARLSVPQATRLNELFMSSRVDYCQLNGISLGLCLNGKIIGKADFQNSKFNWKMPDDGRQIYQLSDLAVPSAEPRLSKLVLLLIQSHEVKKLIDEYFKSDFRWTCTTAFCRGPVSMKYRGVYKLHKRLPGKDGTYRLNYFAPLGQWSIREALEIWLKKYRK